MVYFRHQRRFPFFRITGNKQFAFSFLAFYVCGMSIRGEGTSGAREAFVLLNRCLDLVEAADDESAHLLDYADFGKLFYFMLIKFKVVSGK